MQLPWVQAEPEDTAAASVSCSRPLEELPPQTPKSSTVEGAGQHRPPAAARQSPSVIFTGQSRLCHTRLLRHASQPASVPSRWRLNYAAGATTECGRKAISQMSPPASRVPTQQAPAMSKVVPLPPHTPQASRWPAQQAPFRSRVAVPPLARASQQAPAWLTTPGGVHRAAFAALLTSWYHHVKRGSRASLVPVPI